MSVAWRLILDGPSDGAWNMAVDRTIQLSREAGECPPTVRLYRWARPTVSLGRFQRAESVDLPRCARVGIDVVRRPTGGRGVLHDDELTYSFVAGEQDGVPRGTVVSYRYLCEPLIEAFARLGVHAALTSRSRGTRDSSACYLHATQADLSYGAAKLSGSAQVWHGATCLQHGSFTRTRDVGREAEVFGLDEEVRVELAETTVTLAEALGEAPTFDAIAEAVVRGLRDALGIEVLEAGLLSSEVRRAELMAQDMQLRSDA